MRRIDWVWALGLLLKGVGATWDVAWHFRSLREAFTPPHAINLVGEALVAFALWYEWRHRDAKTTGPLLVVVAGVALFLLAIPFDHWWHVTFGIDLTTWSPAHLMLFYGTAVGAFGVLLLYRSRMGHAPLDRLMLAFYVVFLAGALYFPLTYNEYTTVAAGVIATAPETLDPALVAFANSVEDPIFHGTPKWLYPVYSVAIAAFVGTLARAWLGRGWALFALVALSAERVLADLLITGAGWPAAALPLQFAFMGAAIELAWSVRAPGAVSASAGAIAATAIGYAWFAEPLTWGPVVPLTAASWPAGLAAALAGALLALLLVRRGLRYVETIPEMRMSDVRAWVSARVARR